MHFLHTLKAYVLVYLYAACEQTACVVSQLNLKIFTIFHTFSEMKNRWVVVKFTRRVCNYTHLHSNISLTSLLVNNLLWSSHKRTGYARLLMNHFSGCSVLCDFWKFLNCVFIPSLLMQTCQIWSNTKAGWKVEFIKKHIEFVFILLHLIAFGNIWSVETKLWTISVRDKLPVHFNTKWFSNMFL